jgi:hypothetical protein
MSSYKPITLSAPKPETVTTEQKMDDFIPEARKMLSEAGDNTGLQAEAILKIAHRMMTYNDAIKMTRYIDVLSKEFKIRKGDFNTAIKQAKQEAEETAGDQEAGSPMISRVEAFIAGQYDIYFNIISNQFMYRDKGASEFIEMNIDNIYRELKKNHINYSLSDLKSLMKSDFITKRNVFVEYFENLPPWDGEDHIFKLAQYIKVQEISQNSDERTRFDSQFRKMLVRSVSCSLEVEYNKHCFTFVHEQQSSGKTYFMRWLCPPQLENYFSENIGTSKDDLIALTENFIVNIDELSTLSRYDINALKSVMSKDKIKLRLPYGERPEMLKRRCNFVASTNRLEFLNDETGSVRWICFLLERIDWDYSKKMDINKVWAQAYHLFKNTEFDYQLNADEIKENEEINKTFLIRTPEMELIQKYLAPKRRKDTDSDPNVEFLSATEILNYLNSKITGTIRMSNVGVGKSLKMLGFRQDSFYEQEAGVSKKGYYILKKYDTPEPGSNHIPRDGELPY